MVQGRPRPSNMANMLDAIAAQIPIDAWLVFLITIIDVTRSGTGEQKRKREKIIIRIFGIENFKPTGRSCGQNGHTRNGRWHSNHIT